MSTIPFFRPYYLFNLQRTGQGRAGVGRLTSGDDLSIGWDFESVRRWPTMEDEVRDLSGWIGTGALLEWGWSRGDEAGDC